MEQLRTLALAGPDHGVVDRLVNGHRAHGDGAVGQGLGHGDDVRLDRKTLCGKSLAGTTEACDHFVEHQQDAVAVANVAQALEVASRWYIDADGTGDGLDKARRDAVRTVGGDDALEVAGQVCALGRFAQLITLFFLPGVAHVTDVGQAAGGEGLAVAHHAG
ncbi:hypothetical protein D3C76_272460 [compost metagenome]